MYNFFFFFFFFYSGGIAVYIKEGISNGIQIVRNHFDTIIWLKFDKDFLRTEKDIFLSCVYIWGENSPAYNYIDVTEVNFVIILLNA